MGHGSIDHALAVNGIELVIACQPLVPSQPSKGPLDHPTAGQHFKTFDIIAAQDDLDTDIEFPLGPCEEVSGILPVCPDLG